MNSNSQREVKRYEDNHDRRVITIRSEYNHSTGRTSCRCIYQRLCTGSSQHSACRSRRTYGRTSERKPVYVLCHTGEWSVDAVYELEAAGYDAANIEGGYRSFLRKKLSEFVQDENTTGEKQKEIERSIIKKFRKGIWRKFTKGIREYDLIQDGDKIAVCISGGKDSMLMAKLFQELLKHGKANFELVFLVMNPGYNEDNWKIIQDNAKVLGIPLTVFETQIFDTVADIDKNPCYLCARMRRGYLYSHAKELGCNKIALGHHFDDVIETILMGDVLRRKGGDDDAEAPQQEF